MQPNPEHAQAFPGSEHTAQPPDVTVIDGLIHRYSVKLPLAGTGRWSSTARLGSASSGAGRAAGHRTGPGAGMPRDAAAEPAASPAIASLFSRNVVSGEGSFQGRHSHAR